MKRAILLLVVVVGGAFYLGWFTFTTDNSGPTEHVNIVINRDKVRQDEARALQKLHTYEQQVESQAATSEQSSSPEQPTVARRAAPDQSPPPYQTTQPSGYPTQPGYPTSPVEPQSAGKILTRCPSRLSRHGVPRPKRPRVFRAAFNDSLRRYAWASSLSSAPASG